MIHLREQKSKLEQRLTQLQPRAYQTSMAVATARAIEAQMADLEVQHATDNIDDTLSKANANGGKTLYPKTSIGDLGWVAEFEDSEGNRIALHSQPILST
jgi:predicted enzyme related to lactoylglutathione lyase